MLKLEIGADQRLFYKRLIDSADMRINLAKKLDDVLGNYQRRAKIESSAAKLATLRDLRLAPLHTQQDLAQALGVGQDAISCLAQRSNMLLSTLRRYVEAMGGQHELVASFPNRPSLRPYSLARLVNITEGGQHLLNHCCDLIESAIAHLNIAL